MEPAGGDGLGGVSEASAVAHGTSGVEDGNVALSPLIDAVPSEIVTGSDPSGTNVDFARPMRSRRSCGRAKTFYQLTADGCATRLLKCSARLRSEIVPYIGDPIARLRTSPHHPV